MLFLLFQIGNDRYALEAGHAVEVVPLLALKKVPHAPRGVAGIFNYRGQPVPALDLCKLTFDRPARERLSTRIILVKYSDPSGGVFSSSPPSTRLTSRQMGKGGGFGGGGGPQITRLLGLIAEQVTGMMCRDERDFMDTGVKVGAAPYLGPVLMDDQGVIQLLHAQHLLAGGVRELLFADNPELGHEYH